MLGDHDSRDTASEDLKKEGTGRCMTDDGATGSVRAYGTSTTETATVCRERYPDTVVRRSQRWSWVSLI